MQQHTYSVNGSRTIIRSDGVPIAVMARPPKRNECDTDELARVICRLLNQQPHAQAVEKATQDLIHTLGNFLGVVMNSRRGFMTEHDIGCFTLEKAPGLREALDNLKAAMNRAKIECEE